MLSGEKNPAEIKTLVKFNWKLRPESHALYLQNIVLTWTLRFLSVFNNKQFLSTFLNRVKFCIKNKTK